MDDLLAEFIAETRETLETIAGELVAWESDPADRARLDEIFRFVHTVKGSSGFLDLPQLQRLSHEAEDALSDVRAGKRTPDPEFVSAVLAIVDRIAAIVDALDRGEATEEALDEALIAALEDGEGAAPATASRDAMQRAPARSIRVPVDLLDRLMSGVSDLVLARNELSRQMRRASADHDLDMAFERISGCVAEMRDAITWTRMQRIEGLFAALPRLVRDLSAELGKSVTLEIEGADVELDREMIEMLRDPLTHIVRNALDHGIESPERRRAAGKNPQGVLQVSARQSGNQIQIAIADDGSGIDTGRLVSRAVAARCIDQASAAELDEGEALDLVFHPGLSTAAEVSDVSGRGVGMDVVRANVERIGGSIDLRSGEGTGTTVTLSVPLTLTIIPALIVGSGGSQFAIPRSAIDEIVSLAKGGARVEQVGGAEMVALRGTRIPLVRLAEVFERAGEDGEDIIVVLRPTRGQRFALATDRVFDHEELVVKPAAPGIMGAGIYAGTALPDNGRPLLLLDTAGIAARAGLRLAPVHERHATDRASAAGGETAALAFDDLDGRRRAVRMGLVERIVEVDASEIAESAGAPRFVAGDDILPVVASGPLPESGRFCLLRLGDGLTEIAYAIARPGDVVALPTKFEPAPEPGRIAGIALVDGAPIELLDAHFLFAEQAAARRSTGPRPTCRIVGSDERWMREVLAPLVEAAGYEVGFGAGDGPADVVIEADEAAQSGAGSAEVIRLATAPDTAGDRVYRYDRTGIYHALRTRLRAGG